MRYFGYLAKSLWQPLKIDFDMIFRSAKYMHRTAQIFMNLLSLRKSFELYYFFLVVAQNR